MNVSYLVPLRRSWERTRRLLFSPFRIETWLVVGFAAFLSEWLTGGFGHSGASWRGDPERLGRVVERARDILLDPFWMALLVWLLLGLFVITVLFQWLGARGKFIFLDDVVRERAAIREPWSRYARQGNSLFFFRLIFLIGSVALIVGVLGITITPAIRELFMREPDVRMIFAPMIGTVVVLGCLGLLLAFVLLMLDSFVVPIMYRHEIGVTAAWGRFLSLLGAQPLAFIAYAIGVLVLSVMVFAGLVAVGLATCCVGFLLVALPYVSSVVLLPVHVLFRGLGPEFLAQFGPEFDVFATAPAAAAPGPTAPPLPPPPPPAPPGSGA